MARETYNQLIVVDGPSASGKDSLIGELEKELRGRRSRQVFVLSEDAVDPNRDEIKQAKLRGIEQGGCGDKEMAQVITHHRSRIYQEEVLPRIVRGETVIANRGEPATLAYQTLRDEVTLEEVWNEHRRLRIPTPNLVVITNCSPQTAENRETLRAGSRTGLSGSVTSENGASTQATQQRRRQIHQNYQRVAQFLQARSVEVIELDTDNITLSEEVRRVVKRL